MRHVTIAVLICAASFVPATLPAKAVILGENDLDNFGRTLCDVSESLGPDVPPVGKFILLKKQKEIFVGSGAIVAYPPEAGGTYRTDMVITSSHLFDFEGALTTTSDQKMIYRIWEPDDEGCAEHDYDIADWALGYDEPSAKKVLGVNGRCDTEEYWSQFDPIAIAGSCEDQANDWAVIRLATPVPSYYPFIMASDALVQKVVSQVVPLAVIGYAYHPSTDFGRLLSIATCSSRHMPFGPEYQPFETHFAHDCDVYSGMSGGPFFITVSNDSPQDTPILRDRPQQYLRYIVGVTKGAVGENLDTVDGVDMTDYESFTTFNIAVPINSRTRAAFDRVAAEHPL